MERKRTPNANELRIRPNIWWLVTLSVSALLAGTYELARQWSRERQLCVARICVIETNARGVMLTYKQEDVRIAATGCIVREYLRAGASHHVVRSDQDLDGDGVFDCRDDDCHAASSAPCAFQRDGERWIVDGEWDCSDSCFPRLPASTADTSDAGILPF